ncbi:MAG: alpha/beta hydrolase [Pseudomonadota bacterium]
MSLLLAGAVLSVLIFVGAPKLERALMYHPAKVRVSPEEAGLPHIREVQLKTADGETLVAWYAPAKSGEPTLLYFHGNAGTLADRAERIEKYLSRGRGVFIMAYRGYSGSTGHPSEAANVADARLAYETLRSLGVAAADIVLYGESIGSGVAVQVAAARPAGGIVLDAPYTSLVDVAARCYPYLPSSSLMTDRYETLETHLPRVNAPVFVVHGEQDAIIPVAMGRRIAAAAPAGGEIATFPEAGHTDHYLYGSFEAINDWLERVWRTRRQMALADAV